MMREFTAVSLFCGAGGLDMGFDRAGYKTIWANDFDPDACKTHRSWSNAEVVCGDISKIDYATIPASDVILGGFPCQGFSLSGPRKIDDSRNTLYKHYVKLVRQNKPLAFIGENVKGLLTMGGGQIIDAIIADFADCGYDVFYKLVNAKNFGVPQDRERVIIVGFRKDLNVKDFDLPDTNGESMTLREAIGDMPEAKPGDVCDASYSSRYMSRNRKRGWDEVAYTVPAMAKQVTLWPGSPDMEKMGTDIWKFGSNGFTRRLSWREVAAIQTFPKDLEFFGDLTSIYKQIGNAVPVKLAEFVANYIRPYLEQAKQKQNGGIMKLSNTEQGKAYEYACLMSLDRYLTSKGVGPVVITESEALDTARNAFKKAKNKGLAEKLVLAADAASRVILKLEPQLEYGNGPLTLVIQTDARGIAGDVRDVVCIRNANGWEIGLSCKHNHQAVKHSRLSATIDFGKEWFGVPCSDTYFSTVIPLFNELRDMRAAAVAKGDPLPLWNDMPNKAERYYIPVLRAFLDEMKRLSEQDPSIPKKLIEYMLGRYDFYKVITDDVHRTTRVEAINIAGSLNKPANGHKSIVDVSRLKLPTCFYHMDMVPGSDNKVTIVCDEGWTLTMRIHNASSKIEPSLKFDVQLISVPNSIHIQVEPWEC